MGIRLVHRPARLHQKIPTVKPVQLAQVPAVRKTSGAAGTVLRVMLPIVGGIGMVLMMFSSGNPIRMAVGSIMLVVVVITAIGMYIRSKTGARKQAEEARERFLEHLEEQEPRIITLAKQQREQSMLRNPEPIGLSEVIRQPHRLWERRISDEDFLIVRLGVGTGNLACQIEPKANEDPMSVPEPLAKAHLDRMLKRCCYVDDLPIAVPLHGIVSFIGERPVTANAIRAVLLQSAVLHAPDDLRFHFALPLSGGEDDGQWALWLPHILDDRRFDGPIGRRGVSIDTETTDGLVAEIDERLEELRQKGKTRSISVDRPHLVVVIDMESDHGREVFSMLSRIDDLAKARITILTSATLQHLEPSHVDVRINFGNSRSSASQTAQIGGENKHQEFSVSLLDRGNVGQPEKGEKGYSRRLLYGGDSGIVDLVSTSLAEAVARELSPLRLVEDAIPETPLDKTIALDRLLGIADFHDYDIAKMWQPRTTDDFLNVPFGVDAEGKPVHLDIKESALSGMGPHGLCVGATGSGKSEVLRTIVLGQAICHPPELLSVVLVDYKGGATFAGLEALPHTAAIVDNLEDASGLVDRLHDSILGEIQRRQRVLQQAGNLANVGEYHKLRSQDERLDPLPHLFVVIDEFGELLAAKPEFVNLFVQIGRIGRSIGMHLLLASQRLEEGRLRGLESYLSYRLGLRTFSAQESRSAIGSPDAHELPPIPGSGLLKVDPDIFDRFKAAYVSGSYLSAESQVTRSLPPVAMPLELLNTTEGWLQQREAEFQHQLALESPVMAANEETTLDIVVGRLHDAAEKTRQVWLPPLPSTISLDKVLGPATLTTQRGFSVARENYLTFTLGIKDKPLEQWQGPMSINFLGSNGNGVIIGSPQSGKTTALRTLILSAALSHTPEEVNFYIIDMAGSGFKYLERLPHVGGVTTRMEEEKLHRLVAEIKHLLAERELLFSNNNIESAEQLRTIRASGKLKDNFATDVFLVIDGWSTLKKDYDTLSDEIQNLAQRGLGYGIHVLFTSGRWADFKLPLQAVIGTKIELHINDPLDSVVGKKFMVGMEGAPRGRALTMDKLYNQICLPTFSDPNIGSDNIDELLTSIANGWRHNTAPPVRLLPELITYSDIRKQFPAANGAVVGLDEANLGPAEFDLYGAQRLLLMFGDSQSGKTSTLKTLISEFIRGKDFNEVMVCIVDLRRSLLGLVPPDFIGEYAGTRNSVDVLIKAMQQELDRRQPPANITIEQLQDKSWWSGPELYLVVDDYEMIEGSSNPLRPLIPYFAQAADIGLHVVFSRRSAGVNRTGYESVLQAVREAGANGILLSGDRQEGQVWPGVYMQHLIPGRGYWVGKSGRKRTIQFAYHDS